MKELTTSLWEVKPLRDPLALVGAWALKVFEGVRVSKYFVGWYTS